MKTSWFRPGLSPMETMWQTRAEYWMTGPAPAFSLEVSRTVRARPQDGRVQERDAEKKATQELIGRITKEARWDRYVVRHQDVNSRSRKKLWHKGEESGHIQKVKSIRLDCDNDVILLAIEQIGDIACHTGRQSCFFKEFNNGAWQTVGAVIKNPKDIYK